jgi:hypothetical protein
MSTNRKAYTFDLDLILHDGVALTASAAGNVTTAIGDVDAGARIIDLGSGLVEGDIICDVSSLDVDTDNEMVTIGVQISDDSDFSSTFWQVSSLQIGDEAVVAGDQAMTTGRYVIPFNNMIADGVNKRYLRLYFTIVGTLSFDCFAYLVKRSN